MYISSNSIAVSKNKCVIDGPNTGNLKFGGTDVALQEGRSGTWSCSVYHTNPASTLIWQNDTHTFMPSSPAFVKKVSILVRSLLLSLIIIQKIYMSKLINFQHYLSQMQFFNYLFMFKNNSLQILFSVMLYLTPEVVHFTVDIEYF